LQDEPCLLDKTASSAGQVSKLELRIIIEASKGQNYMTTTQSNKKSVVVST